MRKVYVVKTYDYLEEEYYFDKKRAYQKAMEFNLNQISEYENIFTDGINKQLTKSKLVINNLKEINEPQLQLEYYMKNLEDIYFYYYDGGNETYMDYNYDLATVEEKNLIE
jgi:hypothetical protein